MGQPLDFRVTDPRRFQLKDCDPEDTRGIHSKTQARELLREGLERLRELQERLYAQDRWALLIVFQAMDAAGKDSTIKHVMSGLNPQGCQVFSFKAPSAEELDHDFLWRTTRALPERGRIGVFNRSYYEEVLVVRVHREFLDRQKLPRGVVTKKIWDERFRSINDFERHLGRSGTRVLKFFLNVSKKEQKQRFLQRIDEPAKNWKFSMADVDERRYWDDYMHAYEDMIRHTSTAAAPWHVIPADRKWFMRLAVADAVVRALTELRLEFPKLDARQRAELESARAALEAAE